MKLQPLIKPLILIVICIGFLAGENGLNFNQQTEQLTNEQKSCNAGLDQSPDHYIEKGEMQLNQGNYQQAIIYYDQAICLNSNNPQPYFYRAKAHFGKGNKLAGMNDYMQGFMTAILFGGNVI